MSNAFASGSALGSLVRDYTEEELVESCSSSISESSGSEVEIEKVQPSASAGGGGGEYHIAEKDEYHIAASSVDVRYDLWEFWRDKRMRYPHWYSVAKDMALMQPSSAFMERVFSILRACMDDRQESSYSDRIAASALLKYNRGRGK